MTGFMVRDQSAGNRYFIVAVADQAAAEVVAKHKFELPGPIKSEPLSGNILDFLAMQQNDIMEWVVVQET